MHGERGFRNDSPEPLDYDPETLSGVYAVLDQELLALLIAPDTSSAEALEILASSGLVETNLDALRLITAIEALIHQSEISAEGRLARIQALVDLKTALATTFGLEQ